MNDHDPNTKLAPEDWALARGVRILDWDGWDAHGELGERDPETPITLAEFEQRIALSTITVAELPEADAETEEAAEALEDDRAASSLPWEIHLNQAAMSMQPLRNGGMRLMFAPAVQTPMGHMPTPPGVVVSFLAEEWVAFKEACASDGESVKPRPRIQTARPTDPMLDRVLHGPGMRVPQGRRRR